MSEHKLVTISQQAVIRNENGDILILLKTNTDFWLLPGGRVEQTDVSPIEGFHREIREEIGCDVTVIRPLGVDGNPAWNVYAVAFLCESITKPTISLSEEHSEFKWVPVSEISKYLYYKEIARAIVEQLG